MYRCRTKVTQFLTPPENVLANFAFCGTGTISVYKSSLYFWITKSLWSQRIGSDHEHDVLMTRETSFIWYVQALDFFTVKLLPSVICDPSCLNEFVNVGSWSLCSSFPRSCAVYSHHKRIRVCPVGGCLRLPLVSGNLFHRSLFRCEWFMMSV